MRIQSLAPLFERPGLNLIVSLYRENAELQYTKFVNQIDNKDYFFRVATEGDFSPAMAVNEAVGIDFQDFATPYFMDVYPVKRAVGFGISTEVGESERYGLIAKKGAKMSRAIIKSLEADCANFINLATNAALTTPDGVVFASAAHLADASTYSNILTGTPALSLPALEQAVQEITRQPSHTGDPMMWTGPYKLLVPPELWGLANRLVKSMKVPQSNDNDPNWVGGMISEVVMSPYFTSATAWALVVDNAEDNPMKLVNRRSLTTHEQYAIGNDVNLYTANQIWVKFAKDPRGFIYSGS